MSAEFWYILLGALLAGVALLGHRFRALPVSTAMLYFAVGLVLGNEGFGLVHLDPIADAHFLERCAEAAVLVSLFTAGLKLRLPVTHADWRLAFRLGVGAMAASVLFTALLAHVLLGVAPGTALLLGAMLAPTDPVLASEVQLGHAFERNRVRFGLTGEAGLNDGTALPFLVLALSLHDGARLESVALSWFALKLAYPVVAGVAIGAAAGFAFGRYVLHLRVEHQQGLGYNDFLALGLVGITYGVCQLLHANGFLGVFAAGYGLRWLEMRAAPERSDAELVIPVTDHGRNEIATSREQGPVYLTETVLAFNEHYERVAEFALVILFGIMFSTRYLSLEVGFFVASVFLLARPIPTLLWLIRTPLARGERLATAWLGLRGIGSIYYLAYAASHGLGGDEAQRVMAVVFCTIAASIIIHGATGTWLMGKAEQQ